MVFEFVYDVFLIQCHSHKILLHLPWALAFCFKFYWIFFQCNTQNDNDTYDGIGDGDTINKRISCCSFFSQKRNCEKQEMPLLTCWWSDFSIDAGSQGKKEKWIFKPNLTHSLTSYEMQFLEKDTRSKWRLKTGNAEKVEFHITQYIN